MRGSFAMPMCMAVAGSSVIWTDSRCAALACAIFLFSVGQSMDADQRVRLHSWHPCLPTSSPCPFPNMPVSPHPLHALSQTCLFPHILSMPFPKHACFPTSSPCPFPNTRARLQAVWLARSAGLLQAEACVRHTERDFPGALACCARDARHPASAFAYADAMLGGGDRGPATRGAAQRSSSGGSDPALTGHRWWDEGGAGAGGGLSEEERGGLEGALVEQAPALIQLDPAAAAKVHVG